MRCIAAQCITHGVGQGIGACMYVMRWGTVHLVYGSMRCIAGHRDRALEPFSEPNSIPPITHLYRRTADHSHSNTWIKITQFTSRSNAIHNQDQVQFKNGQTMVLQTCNDHGLGGISMSNYFI